MKTAIAPITRTILEKRSRLINSAKKSVENSQKTGKKPLVQKPPADFTENVMMLAALLDNNNSDKATDRDLATALLKLSLSLKAMPAGTRQDALCNFNVHYQYLYSSSVNHDVTLKKIARFKYYLQNHYSLTDFQFAFNAFQQLLSPEDHERVAHYYQDMLHVDDCIVKKTVRLLSDHVAYQQQLASSKTTVHKFNIFLSQQSDVTDRDKHLVNQILTTAHLQLRDLEGDLAQTMQTSRLLDQARCTALEQRFHDCAQQSLIKPLSSLSLSESPIRQYLCELLVKIKQLLKIDSPNDKIYRFSRQVEQNIRENSHFKLSSPAPAA